MTDDTTASDQYDDQVDDEPRRVPLDVVGVMVFLSMIGLGALIIGPFRLLDGETATGAGLLVAGLLCTALVYGLWRAWRPAHTLANIAAVLIAAAGLPFPLTGGLCLTALGVAMLWSLWRRPAKDWFGIR